MPKAFGTLWRRMGFFRSISAASLSLPLATKLLRTTPSWLTARQR